MIALSTGCWTSTSPLRYCGGVARAWVALRRGSQWCGDGGLVTQGDSEGGRKRMGAIYKLCACAGRVIKSSPQRCPRCPLNQ